MQVNVCIEYFYCLKDYITIYYVFYIFILGQIKPVKVSCPFPLYDAYRCFFVANKKSKKSHVDDFTISYSSKNMATIERQIQLCLNKLQVWADQNGFKFSTTKTVCVHFCRQQTLHLDPVLYLKGTEIPVVEKTKFLGLYFDRKLNFQPHIKYLRQKCEKALNLLRVVSSMDWGADGATLLYLYRSLVRSKLDYGSMVYGSAPKTYLRILEPIQNRALRICLGAFRTSRATSLHVEADEIPLSLRRKKLALQYAIKLKANPSNPTYNCVFKPSFERLFDRSPKTIRTFGLRIKEDIEELDVNLDLVAKFEEPDIPPWDLTPVKVDWTLSEHQKSSTAPDLFLSEFRRIRGNYLNHTFIFTDGSKMNELVAAAAVVRGNKYQFPLPNHSSIFSAELKAIDLALEHIRFSGHHNFVVCSDSKSSLEALQGDASINPLVMKIREKIHITQTNKVIQFIWIPSHIGIRGNDLADSAAKEALDFNPMYMEVPHSDFKSRILPYIRQKWQLEWDREVDNKLQAIKPTLAPPQTVRLSRREEVVYRRLRIGHSYITHSWMLKREEPPMCESCSEDFSIKHILIECAEFIDKRRQFYNVPDMKTLFETVPPSRILEFVKKIGLFYKF